MSMYRIFNRLILTDAKYRIDYSRLCNEKHASGHAGSIIIDYPQTRFPQASHCVLRGCCKILFELRLIVAA